MITILDHLALGTPALPAGWELFADVLGGAWAYGGDSPGYWWGQLKFASGPKIELLTPTGGPDAAFLDRFLAARGAGPHHFNFLVPDIGTALARIKAAGAGTAELTWPGGKRIKLAREDGLPLGGALHHVRFTRVTGAFSTRDRERAALLASQLGLTLELVSGGRQLA